MALRYGGSARRQSPQTGSFSAVTNAGLARRSPQTEHRLPESGRMASRHSGQTGSREMLVRGSPQRRQSEGKRTLKRAAARLLRPETMVDDNELSAPCSLHPSSRVGIPLLLKTVLPRPDAALGAPPGRFTPSIAGFAPEAQCGKTKQKSLKFAFGILRESVDSERNTSASAEGVTREVPSLVTERERLGPKKYRSSKVLTSRYPPRCLQRFGWNANPSKPSETCRKSLPNFPDNPRTGFQDLILTWFHPIERW